MTEITRTIPFDYYLLGFTSSPSDKLLYRVAYLVREIFENIAYVVANIGIKLANILHLYSFTKIEVPSNDRPPFYTPNQALIAYCFIAVNIVNKLLGKNSLSWYATAAVNILQRNEGAPNSENPTMSNIYIIASLFLQQNTYFQFGFSAWTTYSVIKNTYNGTKTCYEYAYRDPIQAVKGTIFHLANVAAVLSNFNQTYLSDPIEQNAS